ncbi:hypothetical protein [Negadavirga shengliensis]|uniref:Uncharacterized protein n=1 Tax=Negadavirga shengliensis TaxID=1389218 RepID=A0ABV9SUP0_9BACT
MINRLIISLASILSSLVLAYAHLKEGWKIRNGLDPDNAEIPENIHILSTTGVITETAAFVFGFLFLIIGLLAILFSWLKYWHAVFFCFVAAMLAIWVRVMVGAG